LFKLNGVGSLCQWYTPNSAGHRRLIMSAGFAIERATRPYVIPFGVSHPPRQKTPYFIFQEGLQRAAGRAVGIPTTAVLARPNV
jgi:hypothetical protein